MSVGLLLDPASVDQSIDYVQQTQLAILAAIVSGMQEAMQGLAWTVADKLQGSPIVSRSGDLLDVILTSPKVTETSELIRGTVSSDVGAKHLGLWLEEGTHVPAVGGHLYEFTEPDGQSFFTRGHGAFDVKPHPFLNPSLQEDEDSITQLISDAVQGAIEP